MCLMKRVSIDTETVSSLLRVRRSSIGLAVGGDLAGVEASSHELVYESEPEPELELENPPSNVDRSHTPALHWYDDVRELASFYSGLGPSYVLSHSAAVSDLPAAVSAPIVPVFAAVDQIAAADTIMSEASPLQTIKTEDYDPTIDMTRSDGEEEEEEEEEEEDADLREIEDALVGESVSSPARPPVSNSTVRPTAPNTQHSRQERRDRNREAGRARAERTAAFVDELSAPSPDVPAFFQNNGLILRNAEGRVQTNEASLPTEKSFTIQVGPETFRLSGASINSDAPSYFSRYFESELAKRAANKVPASEPMRTLYIDRDPATFRDIALHLQGYHVQPRDSTHYVRLFADAQFYILPRLVKHLWESDVFIRIGEDEFCVPRDLFTLEPGNTPNYFTLGFSLLFSTPSNPFPGLDASGLLRPPAIKAASASGRSGRIFADILDLLRGYEVHIRDEEHRAALLRDCRYYHLRGLEQKIIPHALSWNEGRKTSEIVLRLEDLRQSGISVDNFPAEPISAAARAAAAANNIGGSSGSGAGAAGAGGGMIQAVRYARPFIDNAESPHELIIETGPDSATIRPGNNFVVEFHNEARQRVMSLFKVVKAKLEANMKELSMMGGAVGGGGSGGHGPTEPRGEGGIGGEQQQQEPVVFIINEDGQANARIESDAVVTVDGEEGWLVHPSAVAEAGVDEDDETAATAAAGGMAEDGPSLLGPEHQAAAAASAGRRNKRRRLNGRAGEPPAEACHEWSVRRSQWRIRCQSWTGSSPWSKSVAIHMYAVSLDVVVGQKGRNRSRGFISS